MTEITPVTTDMFEQAVLQAPLPVIIDFWATWCGPCRAMMPLVEELSREYAGEVQIVKIDIDAEADLAARLGIRGVPTFLRFEAGKEVGRAAGAMSRTRFAAFIEGAA